ncbi:hypothetical protein CVT26_013390 [Gymnopilus dilepis]|uniref:Uncharacterized protein n=1 Tax=Gymnopilus dilepis TaxID=231916 RepID=A0A409WDB0_9AGAR|nr:hypothetical protein CVT26_013390 [Gymnopilus dilepis]
MKKTGTLGFRVLLLGTSKPEKRLSLINAGLRRPGIHDETYPIHSFPLRFVNKHLDGTPRRATFTGPPTSLSSKDTPGVLRPLHGKMPVSCAPVRIAAMVDYDAKARNSPLSKPYPISKPFMSRHSLPGSHPHYEVRYNTLQCDCALWPSVDTPLHVAVDNTVILL